VTGKGRYRQTEAGWSRLLEISLDASISWIPYPTLLLSFFVNFVVWAKAMGPGTLFFEDSVGPSRGTAM
jgi:hypothetical protein